jgi:hypothetical protein
MASLTRLLSLGLSAAATVLLGLADLQGTAEWGFVCAALVTTVGAIEPFFNWRSRWIMAEEAMADWYRLDRELGAYIAGTHEQELDREKLLEFDRQSTLVWSRFSAQWLEQRRGPDAFRDTRITPI